MLRECVSALRERHTPAGDMQKWLGLCALSMAMLSFIQFSTIEGDWDNVLRNLSGTALSK